jgi:hypothetical protein
MNRMLFHPLFLPLLFSGIIITTFGFVLKVLGEILGLEGEGLSIIGIRLIIGGLATISLAFFAQYYCKIARSLSLLKFFIINFKKRNKVFGR